MAGNVCFLFAISDKSGGFHKYPKVVDTRTGGLDLGGSTKRKSESNVPNDLQVEVV